MFRSLCLAALLAPLEVLAATNAVAIAQIQSADRAQRVKSVQRANANLPYYEWRPALESRVQMILAGAVDANATVNVVPHSAEVFDIDLFNNDATTIAAIKERGFRVICYFSAGTAENWRPDFKNFTDRVLGKALPEWPGERWIDNRDPEVLNIMNARIKLAWWNGCDAVDPDNIDVYSNEKGGGFDPPITRNDSIRYIRNLAYTAHTYGLGIGLKNADELLPHVQDVMQFAVNEECITYNGSCTQYEPFVNPQEWYSRPKPVYHVEYVTHVKRSADEVPAAPVAPVAPTTESSTVAAVLALPAKAKRQNLFSIVGSILGLGLDHDGNSNRGASRVAPSSLVGADSVTIGNENYPNMTQFELRKQLCAGNQGSLGPKLNTIIKSMNLNGWVMYCDGEVTETITRLVNNGHIDAPANYNATTGAVGVSPEAPAAAESPDTAAVATPVASPAFELTPSAPAVNSTSANTTISNSGLSAISFSDELEELLRSRALANAKATLTAEDILFAPCPPLDAGVTAAAYAASQAKTEQILADSERVMRQYESAAKSEGVNVHPAWRFESNRGTSAKDTLAASVIESRRRAKRAVAFGSN